MALTYANLSSIFAETENGNRWYEYKCLALYGVCINQSNVEKDWPPTDQVRVNEIPKENTKYKDQSPDFSSEKEAKRENFVQCNTCHYIQR